MYCMLYVHSGRGRCVDRFLSYERRESRQRSPGARHVVHNYLAAVQTDDRAALGLRVRVAGVVPHRPLSLPGLTQRVVHVSVVIHERMRFGSNALVVALRVLDVKIISIRPVISRIGCTTN